MELKQDYLTQQWVLISKSRANRPMSFVKEAKVCDDDVENCPFCPHNKHMTADETFAHGNVRVIKNKYPAISLENGAEYGFHEVILDSPDHNFNIATCEQKQLEDVLYVLRQRFTHFKEDKNIKHIQIFKNNGANSAASLNHSHWQLLALPFVPFVKSVVLSNFDKYKRENDSCYLCDLMANEKQLVIFETENVCVFSPSAPLHYSSVTIATKGHKTNLDEIDDGLISEFATCLQAILRALMSVFENLSYNITFECAPIKGDELGAEFDNTNWHFYMQILPRISQLGGFELSSGCFINSSTATETVAKLKKALNNQGF